MIIGAFECPANLGIIFPFTGNGRPGVLSSGTKGENGDYAADSLNSRILTNFLRARISLIFTALSERLS